MTELRRNVPAEELFRYMEGLDFPSQYHPDFGRWEAPFSRDRDGEGRTLFASLDTAGAYVDGTLAGFVFARRGVTRSYRRDDCVSDM